MENKITTVCQKSQCVGCMACVDLCPQNAISMTDTGQTCQAVIDEDACIHCGICRKVCQNDQEVTLRHPKEWVQGWINDDALRGKSASGGAAKAISRQFVREGGVVVSCCFRNGIFGFEEAKSLAELDKFTGSKYVKSNPTGVYRMVQDLLKQGKKVLFIGLPCQVGALKTVVKECEQLYTIDLICHGTPSPKLLRDFLAFRQVNLETTDSISFRYKSVYGLDAGLVPLLQPGSCDEYMLAFLNGLDYTENCYECRYAGISRVGDLTVGDSWGSDLEESEQRRGISLMLCQTKKGEQLLERADMTLLPVDLECAVRANGQLRAPSPKTKQHDLFFAKYPKRTFHHAVITCLPVKYLKQRVKAQLVKRKILQGGTYGVSVRSSSQ